MILPAFSRRTALGLALAAASVFALPASALAPGFVAFTPEKFAAALKGPTPVVVHVHAGWCPVCKRQEAAFELMKDTPDYAKVTKFNVNFDVDTDFLKANNVQNQSVILVFKGGKEIARLGGVTERAKIAELISNAVK